MKCRSGVSKALVIDAARRFDIGHRVGVKRLTAARPSLAWPADDLAALSWYGITTRAGAEFAVEAMLERSGLVALVPMRKVFRKVNRYAKRKQAVAFPIMPRYVIIGFAMSEMVWSTATGQFEAPWRQRVLDLPIPVVPVGIEEETPWRMDGVKVAEFLKRNGQITAADVERYMRTHGEFGEGDTVDIIEGPFSGYSGKVHVISGAEAKVLLPLFGNAEQDVRVPLANLEKSA
jgi:transcription antitermination factor NusG